MFRSGADFLFFGDIWEHQINAETASSNGAIWEEFCEQHYTKASKKYHT